MISDERPRGRGGGVMAKKILIVEDEPDILQLIRGYLEKEGYRVTTALTGLDGIRQTPILILTAKSEEADTVIGLELGADEYVTKPFSPKALVARVKALFRRLDRQPEELALLSYGSLTVDVARHEVKDDGRPIVLTAKEFGLLVHLLQNPGRVLTRDVLLNSVWGYDYYGTTRTVDVHVRRLKQKMPVLNNSIVSVKSLGYKLKEADRTA